MDVPSKLREALAERYDLSANVGPERFLREVEIAKLEHPHILPVHDSGESDGFLCYVMPFVDGESLRAKLDREGESPVEEAIRILRELVDALSHAHTASVMPRDTSHHERHAFRPARARDGFRDRQARERYAVGAVAYSPPHVRLMDEFGMAILDP